MTSKQRNFRLDEQRNRFVSLLGRAEGMSDTSVIKRAIDTLAASENFTDAQSDEFSQRAALYADAAGDSAEALKILLKWLWKNDSTPMRDIYHAFTELLDKLAAPAATSATTPDDGLGADAFANLVRVKKLSAQQANPHLSDAESLADALAQAAQEDPAGAGKATWEASDFGGRVEARITAMQSANPHVTRVALFADALRQVSEQDPAAARAWLARD